MIISIRKTRIQRATTLSGVEDFKILLGWDFQASLNNRQPCLNKTDAKEQSPLPVRSEPDLEASFCTFSDQIVLKERSGNIETPFIANPTIKQLLVRDGTGCILVQVEEAAKNLVL